MSDNRELPRGWVDTSLAAVGTLYCGQSPSVSEVNHSGHGTPYVTGPDQWDGSTLTVDKWTTNPKRLVPDGCIFITVKGAGVGTLFAGVACAIGRDVYAYKPARELSRKFIEHSLRYNISQILRHAKGDIPGLSKDHILGHQTSFPPLNEQRRIVAKIEELFSDLDAGVAALNRAKANLKRYRAAVLKAAVEGKLTEEWRVKHPNTEPASKLLTRILTERRQKWEGDQLAKFAAARKELPKNWKDKYIEPTQPDMTGLPELPEVWLWASVQQVGSVQLGRQRAPQHHSGQNMRPYLRVANVFEDRIDASDVMEMNFTPQEFETYRLGNGDILLNEGQSMELVGRPAIYRDEVPGACFTNTLVRFRVYEGVDTNYALKVFLAYLKNGRFQKIATITVNIAHLGAGRFSEIEFPLPPIQEQAAIINEVDRHFSLIDSAEKAINSSLDRAARLRQSILKQAFEGKLVPQISTDEPASILLARIQQLGKTVSAISIREPLKPQKAAKEVLMRRASVISYTVRRLASHRSFGRTQLEKVVHLTQCHLGVDLDFHFQRYAAGPFDKDIYKLEYVASKNDWFATHQRPNYGVTYHPGGKIDDMCRYAQGYLGRKQADLDRLLDHIAGMNTDDAELFATTYAAWNDLLIDGRHLNDDSIISEVHGWHPEKARFTAPMIRSRLNWMREHGYVPTGQGERTEVVAKETNLQSRANRRKPKN